MKRQEITASMVKKMKISDEKLSEVSATKNIYDLIGMVVDENGYIYEKNRSGWLIHLTRIPDLKA